MGLINIQYFVRSHFNNPQLVQLCYNKWIHQYVRHLLTLSAHAREGYSSRFVCVCHCVCHTLALKRQDCFDVRDRHRREAGKGAIGLNVADF